MAVRALALQPLDDLPNRKTHKWMPPAVRTALVALLFAAFFVAGLLYYFTSALGGRNLFQGSNENPSSSRAAQFPLHCQGNLSETCPADYYPSGHHFESRNRSHQHCPDYFLWIHEDLKPWKNSGITSEMVMAAAGKEANFRLVILNGKLYIETYEKAFQTRDIFTIWGFLQLLRRYPGMVPDLELMFHCGDLPVIMKGDSGENQVPPPLFRYCGDDDSFGIVFPDWSFWGWPEIYIKPWEALLEDLRRGNRRTKWIDRAPQAYWKGNPEVSQARLDLLGCNTSSDGKDWNVRVYKQDWLKEIEEGFKNSDLADQCTHRYKIYVEGRTWSVSAKYILACDSVTLMVRSNFYDFFTRSLEPLKHYWPVNDSQTQMCRSIKYAVDWGNSHQKQAEEIGRDGSRFILEEVKMEHIYDYMFHVLNEYAKLLKYKPSIPEKAIEVCSESMACSSARSSTENKFMRDSLVDGPDGSPPCEMPPRLDPPILESFVRSTAAGREQVGAWEREYWNMRQTG